MKISTAFRITLILFGFVLTVVVASLVVTNQQANRFNEQESVAKNIEQAAADLTYLSNDYLLYREDRQRVRWQNKLAEVSKDLTQLEANNPEQQATVDRIKDNLGRLRAVFNDVVMASRGMTQAQINASVQPLIQVSWNRMTVQNRIIAFDSHRLTQSVRDQGTTVRQRNDLLIIMLIATFSIYLLANYLIVYRRTLLSLRELQAGAAKIGSGNLGFALPVRHNDEFGDLSKTFNQMTVDLKTVTASKDSLESEISKRQQVELELLREKDETSSANEALRAVNDELEAFSYSVSHDLKAPIRAIDGFSRILLEDYGAKLDAAGIDHLNTLRSESKRMADLIDDLLTLSRSTRGEVKRQSLDISLLAKQAVDKLATEYPERRVKVSIETGLAGEGDKTLVTAVLDNLIGNAWKFTAHNPGAEIEFGAVKQKNEVVYFVRDNGVGFDMAYTDKLFSPFQRYHEASEFPGTGIGLATVQRIINHHRGRVWAESEPGKGSTFFFTLG